MKGIIILCIRRPVSVIMLMAALFMGAVYSARLLPMDRLPEIIYPKLTVETAWPGMGAAEIRRALTIPLEDSLSSVKGLGEIRSVSRDGESLLLLGFRWGTNPAQAAALAREALDAIYPALPYGVSKPALVSGGGTDEPHAIVAVRALSGGAGFAGNLAEYELRSRFRKIDGAGAVIVSGGVKQEIKIRADPARLAARSLNVNDLGGIIAGETGDFPAGSAREGDFELSVLSSGRPKSEDELSRLIVSSKSGPLDLDSFTVIGRESARRESLFLFRDGEETALEIYRRPGADPIRLSKDIKAEIKECSALFSRDAEISLVFDSSPSILGGVKDLVISGALAAFAVILLLALFLGRLSCSVLAALSLPFSASAALIILAVSGRSLNSMSLGGMALGIGLVSDASVIVLDLFCRRFASLRGSPPPVLAGETAASVSLSSFAGALTTVAVFLPVIFLPGPLGELFGDLAVALIASVASGWFYAQFCLPSLFCFLAERFFSGTVRDAFAFSKSAGLKMEKAYRSFLRGVIRNPVPLLAISVSASVLGISLLCFRPAEFIAPETISEIEVAVEFPSGTSLESAAPQGLNISGILSELPEISSLYGRMGSEADDTLRRADPSYKKERLLFRCFLAEGLRAERALERIREALRNSDLPAELRISAGYPEDRSAKILGLRPALTFALKGNTPEECAANAELLAAAFRRDAGSALESVHLRPSGTRPQLRLSPRREQSASLGISAYDISTAVYAATAGIVAGSLEIEGRPLDLRVQGAALWEDPDLLESLPISPPVSQDDSGPAYLGSLVDIEWIEAGSALMREDRSDVVYMDIFPSAGKETRIKQLVRERETQGFLRADESVLTRYKSVLRATVILVLALLYLILCAQFESFRLPFILMLAVPFSLAGAGPALLLSGSSLDSGAVLGLVALFGISVNNGIVFYEISEEKIRSGCSPAAAVYSGALERFRPVLLTTLTTVCALLPLLVSPLGNSGRSMSAGMLGGILVSAFLAFFALPPVFISFLKSRRRPRL